MRFEFKSTIINIRNIEDCIRATKKYTEGISTMRKQRPIQGTEFPSKVFCKYYEVYPETEISWDMPANTAIDLLWRDVPCVDVIFRYDYRHNVASITIQNGNDAMSKMVNNIPNLGKILSQIPEYRGIFPVKYSPHIHAKRVEC